ncbi:transcriptional regulator GcvA [Rhodovulum sp. DZ06]|uniref:transcriptional regulator GcvA n=1 Tax=Rhodovulum sp. DZ06 TaxID=3425126 RepID=UPI003D331D9B
MALPSGHDAHARRDADRREPPARGADRMPPLTALRAFEAAARHMSFARAAEELSVTPAALSYQIKRLEAHLGVALFHRLNRAVALTEAGAALRPGVADGFAAFLSAQAAVRRLAEDGALNVTAGPAVTGKWLAPRMMRFAQAHPEIELRFVASLRVLDLERDGVDAAIRYGPQPPEELFSVDLGGERLVPLCTPQVAQALRRPGDLLGATLLHDDSMGLLGPAYSWPDWMERAGLPRAAGDRGPRFSNADHAIGAAASGAGVVLARAFLAEPDVAAGRLVAPFPISLPGNGRYYFVCLPGAQVRPRHAAFLRWLQAEAAETRAAVARWLSLAPEGEEEG